MVLELRCRELAAVLQATAIFKTEFQVAAALDFALNWQMQLYVLNDIRRPVGCFSIDYVLAEARGERAAIWPLAKKRKRRGGKQTARKKQASDADSADCLQDQDEDSDDAEVFSAGETEAELEARADSELDCRETEESVDDSSDEVDELLEEVLMAQFVEHDAAELDEDDSNTGGDESGEKGDSTAAAGEPSFHVSSAEPEQDSEELQDGIFGPALSSDDENPNEEAQPSAARVKADVEISEPSAEMAPAAAENLAAAASAPRVHGSGSKVAAQTYVIVPGGRITYYENKKSFEAKCQNPEHGETCKLTRTAVGSDRSNRTAQGRPLGLLCAWLADNKQSSKSSHWINRYFTQSVRKQHRDVLSTRPGAADILSKERARRAGEDSEPDDDP